MSGHEQPVTVITPKGGPGLGLGEIWRYRDLVLLFVRRDFVSVYKQTVLGPLWFLIQPLLTTLTFTVIFGKVAKIPTGEAPPLLFYLAGVVCWKYFSECLVRSSATFITNAPLFGKVYFPRLTVPVAMALSHLLGFAIQFALFLGFLAFYWGIGAVPGPGPLVVLVPALLAIMATLGLGLGAIVSALTTKYRDLQFLVSFGVQLFMFATPVVYPLSLVPERFRMLALANPMTAVVETFRFAFLGSGEFSWLQLGCSAGTALAVLALGLAMFRRVEGDFMDTV